MLLADDLMEWDGTSARSSDQGTTAAEIKEITAKAIRTGMGTCANMVTMEILRATYNPMVMAYLDRGIIGYLGAAGALAFSGKDITGEGIVNLLRAAGIDPNDQYLNAVSRLNYKNELVYVNGIYFSRANGVEPTIDKLVEVIRSLGVEPDHRIAGYVLEYSKEYITGEYNFISQQLNAKGAEQNFFKTLYLGMLDLSEAMAELAIKELNSNIEASEARTSIGPDALPYLSAIGSLAFAGRDLTIENISALISSIGITPDPALLAAYAPVRFRNPIPYAIGLYYLYTVQVPLSAEMICKVVNTLVGSSDEFIAEYVFAYYKSKQNENRL